MPQGQAEPAQETSAVAGGVAVGTGESLRWSVRPARREPVKAAVVFGFALLALLAGVLFFGSPLLGLLGFAIILAATAEYWLGTSYRLDKKGATARCGVSVTSMGWEQVRRVTVGNKALRLSPLAAEGAMDPFRGVTLRFEEADRERVLESVRRSLPEGVRFLEG